MSDVQHPRKQLPLALQSTDPTIGLIRNTQVKSLPKLDKRSFITVVRVCTQTLDRMSVRAHRSMIDRHTRSMIHHWRTRYIPGDQVGIHSLAKVTVKTFQAAAGPQYEEPPNTNPAPYMIRAKSRTRTTFQRTASESIIRNLHSLAQVADHVNTHKLKELIKRILLLRPLVIISQATVLILQQSLRRTVVGQRSARLCRSNPQTRNSIEPHLQDLSSPDRRAYRANPQTKVWPPGKSRR